MAESLTDEQAREFASEARDYIVGNLAAHSSRPRFVLGFAKALEMDLHSADTAFKEAERVYYLDLVRAGYRHHIRG